MRILITAADTFIVPRLSVVGETRTSLLALGIASLAAPFQVVLLLVVPRVLWEPSPLGKVSI